MKAVVYRKYGSPDVLKLEEVPKPVPKEGQVLVKVRAASINSWDWDMVRGKPFMVRMLWGLTRPKHTIPGADIAGVVEEAGYNVTKFKAGDDVFGDLCEAGWGGFAEYVCAPESALARMPAGMSYEDAAAVPQAAVMALQGLRDKKQVEAGHKVLINGAGGGAGTFAIQMANMLGAEVTAVDSAKKLAIMRSLGADRVVDYTREDFAKSGQLYDLILDFSCHRSVFAYRRVLAPGGHYVMVGGATARMFEVLVLGSLLSRKSDRKMGILGVKPNKDLEYIRDLLEGGKLRPVVDRVYPLAQVPDAFRYFAGGDFKGKVVISIGEDEAESGAEAPAPALMQL